MVAGFDFIGLVLLFGPFVFRHGPEHYPNNVIILSGLFHNRVTGYMSASYPSLSSEKFILQFVVSSGQTIGTTFRSQGRIQV